MATPDASSPPRYRPRPRTSRLAILALGLNVPCFLPPFTLAAAILGVIAYVRVRLRDDLGGAALALAAIVLGIGLTITVGTYWYGFIRLTLHGPADAIRAAERGDGDAVRRLFVGGPDDLSDAEIRLFAETLRERYGEIRGGRIQRIMGDPPRQGQVWEVPFRLEFELGTVKATAGITTVDPATGRSTLALESLTIEDPERGDLRFPRRSRTLSEP